MINVRLLSAALLLIAGAAAQDAPPAPKPAASLVIQLKARRLSTEKAEAIVTELCARPTRFRIQASAALRKQFLNREKIFDKQAAKVLRTFESVAKKAQKALLGREGARTVATLRSESLAVTRGPDLSKSAIKREIDPRIEQLRELLMPDFADIIRADEKLDLRLTELRVAHGELRDWFRIYASATAGLELHADAQKHFAKLPMPNGPGDEDQIDAAIAFATFAGLTMSGSDRQALQANHDLKDSTPREEYLGTLELNRLRYLLGLRLLRNDPKLSDAARDHSKDMANLGFFSHTSPVQGKQRFGQRAANFGTSAGAENIAAGQSTGTGAIRAWWYSPGHHKNMLGNHGRAGLGQHARMWTQMLGG